ncbi:GNAT family N-acetyltransferase [soil metagenome]
MSIEIGTLPTGGLRALRQVVASAFGDEMSDAEMRDLEQILEIDRVVCATEGSTIVGGAGAFSYGLTIPGGEARAAGVTAVGVAPSHRRQGILRRMMRYQLDDVHQRGEPLAILWASEGGIYQRYGYGLATVSASVDVERSRNAFRQPSAPEGRIRMVPREEADLLFPPVYEKMREANPGFFTRSPEWWATEVLNDPEYRRYGRGPCVYAVWDLDGAPGGYVLYRVQQEWDARGSNSTLHVHELMATTPAATRELWRFVFDVDLMVRTRARLLAPDHPLLLLMAEPRRLGLSVGDGLWLRIVDVAGALGARSYAADDSLVLGVADEFCPWNAGRWYLAASGGSGSAERTDREPDLVLDVSDLAAVYLGAFTFARLHKAGRGVEHRPGAGDRADAMFRVDRAPWCPQIF